MRYWSILSVLLEFNSSLCTESPTETNNVNIRISAKGYQQRKTLSRKPKFYTKFGIKNIFKKNAWVPFHTPEE